LDKENGLIIAVKQWAKAIMDFFDEITESQKQLTHKEIEVMKKVVKSAIVLVANPDPNIQYEAQTVEFGLNK
jgi:hypothetical protein